MASTTGIKTWAIEYFVHTPCNQWFEEKVEPETFNAILMEEVYENPKDDMEITGFKCPKCGQVWDLVPRNKPA